MTQPIIAKGDPLKNVNIFGPVTFDPGAMRDQMALVTFRDLFTDEVDDTLFRMALLSPGVEALLRSVIISCL